MTRARPLALTLLLAFAPLALAQPDTTKPQPQPEPQQPAAEPEVQDAPPEPVAEPEPTLVLRELLVLQTDRYDDTANNPKLIPTTLFNPIPHQGRAKRVNVDGAYEFVPMPLGLITFQGTIDEPIKLRLTLNDSRDRFQAHWPPNAIEGDRFVQWQDVVTGEDQLRAIPFGNDQNWLDSIRNGDDRLWFQSRGGESKERFLLYDVALRFKPAIDLTLTDEQYRLATRAPEQAAPPLSILVRKSQAGWSSDALAAPWTITPAPIATKHPDATSATSLAQALEPIKDLLTSRGYNAQEIELALGMIASAGFDKSNMSLVYVLPVGVIDEHIRLQIKPAPDQVIRTAIVVVNNVDPDLSSVINALLDDLGSEQWFKRDRAQRELITLGQAAIKKVQQLKSNKDPEIAFRARQILEEYDWKMNGGNK